MLEHDTGVADELGDLVERFDHIAVASHDIASQVPLARLLGGRFRSGGDYQAGGFRWAQFALPGSAKLELIQPLDPGDATHFLVRFLSSRGEGVHHLTFKVSDIHAAVARARELGFEVVNVGAESEMWKEAFIHPRSAHGVLVQLAEWTDRPQTTDVTLEDVLAGRSRM